MDLNVAVIVGRLTATPELRYRSGETEAVVLRLAARRPVREGRQPPGVDLVDVAVDGALTARMADRLVKGRRIIAAGRLEYRAPKGGTPCSTWSPPCCGSWSPAIPRPPTGRRHSAARTTATVYARFHARRRGAIKG
jgi:Single-strand binding protein family